MEGGGNTELPLFRVRNRLQRHIHLVCFSSCIIPFFPFFSFFPSPSFPLLSLFLSPFYFFCSLSCHLAGFTILIWNLFFLQSDALFIFGIFSTTAILFISPSIDSPNGRIGPYPSIRLPVRSTGAAIYLSVNSAVPPSIPPSLRQFRRPSAQSADCASIGLFIRLPFIANICKNVLSQGVY